MRPAKSFLHDGENAPSASSYYVHADHQRSVRALTDDAGAVVNEYSYDIYGRPETSVEALPQPFPAVGFVAQSLE